MKTPTGYVALRKGRNNVRNCIFLNWFDAEIHINEYDDAEYSIIDTLQDAEKYIISNNKPLEELAVVVATSQNDQTTTTTFTTTTTTNKADNISNNTNSRHNTAEPSLLPAPLPPATIDIDDDYCGSIIPDQCSTFTNNNNNNNNNVSTTTVTVAEPSSTTRPPSLPPLLSLPATTTTIDDIKIDNNNNNNNATIIASPTSDANNNNSNQIDNNEIIKQQTTTTNNNDNNKETTKDIIPSYNNSENNNNDDENKDDYTKINDTSTDAAASFPAVDNKVLHMLKNLLGGISEKEGPQKIRESEEGVPSEIHTEYEVASTSRSESYAVLGQTNKRSMGRSERVPNDWGSIEALSSRIKSIPNQRSLDNESFSDLSFDGDFDHDSRYSNAQGSRSVSSVSSEGGSLVRIKREMLDALNSARNTNVNDLIDIDDRPVDLDFYCSSENSSHSIDSRPSTIINHY